jgi:glycosyltransferase involved in cell wall biosynthesis
MIIFSHRKNALTTTEVTDQLTLHPTNSKTKAHMLFDAYRIARDLIQQNKTQTVVTTQDPFETSIVGFFLKQFCNVEWVVQEHGDFFGHPYWRRESMLNRVRYGIGLWLLTKADRVRVVSLRTKDRLTKRNIKQVTVLPVAINPKSFETAHSDSYVRDHFGTDTFVFLSVARFVPQKNLMLLINAFAVAYAQNQRARLLIVGSGAQKDALTAALKQRYGDSSPVTILPWSKNVAGLMKACDAYALSSNYEGWGRVLVEAVAAGVPVVTTDVGCVGEVVKDAVQGIVVPVNDTHAFAAALIKMSTDTNFYENCKRQIKDSATTIPGTNSTSYGADWIRTLTPAL